MALAAHNVSFMQPTHGYLLPMSSNAISPILTVPSGTMSRPSNVLSFPTPGISRSCSFPVAPIAGLPTNAPSSSSYSFSMPADSLRRCGTVGSIVPGHISTDQRDLQHMENLHGKEDDAVKTLEKIQPLKSKNEKPKEKKAIAGMVCAMPLVSKKPPQACAVDPNQRTMADDASIRPVLSPLAAAVISGSKLEINAWKDAEAPAAAGNIALEQKDAEGMASVLNKRKDEENIIKSDFELDKENYRHNAIKDEGHAKKSDVEKKQDKEISGHYVVSNVNLKSSAPGITYRSSGGLSVSKVQLFGSVVVGTEQSDGWLKVNDRYLPMQVDGRKVIFAVGEPKIALKPKLGTMVVKVKKKVQFE
mmetsp:Transcript_51155/g.81131  ORF Transcript_51155/g.81131 Transcript_51155/m.81131 type:complete len:361 (+) Transcript_51155:113-1195(+)